MKSTWVKILEYASSPLHGTMSRKLRKGVQLQINEGRTYAQAVLFIGDLFVRLTETDPQTGTINTYYDFEKIGAIRTISTDEPASGKK